MDKIVKLFGNSFKEQYERSGYPNTLTAKDLKRQGAEFLIPILHMQGLVLYAVEHLLPDLESPMIFECLEASSNRYMDQDACGLNIVNIIDLDRQPMVTILIACRILGDITTTQFIDKLPEAFQLDRHFNYDRDGLNDLCPIRNIESNMISAFWLRSQFSNLIYNNVKVSLAHFIQLSIEHLLDGKMMIDVVELDQHFSDVRADYNQRIAPFINVWYERN